MSRGVKHQTHNGKDRERVSRAVRRATTYGTENKLSGARVDVGRDACPKRLAPDAKNGKIRC